MHMEPSIRSVTPGVARRAGHRRHSWARHRALVLGAVAVLSAALFGIAVAQTAQAGTVGAGSYLDSLPAGRSLPVGCGSLSTNPRQYVTANAPAGGVPTNDWWSSLLFKKFDCSYSEPLHAHPISYDTLAGGLGFSYNTTAAISGSATGPGEFHYPYVQDMLVGVAGLNSPDTKVDGWSDWTVTPYWSDGARTMKATIGHGLPFAYFQITGGNAQLTTAATPTVWSNSGGQIGFNVNGRDYVAYAPTGSTWTVSGTSISSTLNGQGFFSVAVLPAGADRAALATTYGQYAHAHVTGTRVSYSYNQAASTLNTTYTFTTTARQGSQTATVAALYPHQWNSLTGASPLANTYTSARGQMKILTGIGSFTTSMKYTGVLPEIPAVADSSGADLTTITNYLNAVAGNPADFRGDDTYWTGKGLGRAARIAEIADQLNLTSIRDTALSTIRTRLNDWFTASAGKTTRVFYYNSAWGTLLGYPASYGSDQELNDHHFHYGYYVAAAATLAKFDPTWATNSQYGGMVDLLIRDANNYDRTDTRFPYLRDFDIYAGHDWAAGHGAFGAGNNQESSSEGMNFANALIQWGQATGNAAVRDAGIFIYTTQSAAIAEYWFDVRNQNFPAAFGHNTVGMVWGDGGAYATWFSGEPEMIQGINMLPITGGHFYLGDNPAYVQTNYNELVTNNGGAPTVWQDILWEFLALGNGQTALNNFNANSGFTSEEGESKAHTYHWIRNLAALGNVDNTITANHPLAKVFNKSGVRTYVASNIANTAITVTFSNGTTLNVPACKTVTSGAFTWTGGNACGGGNPSPSNPPSSPPASPSPSPSAPPSPSPSTSPNPPGTFAATRYLVSGGGLPGTAGGAGTATVAAANGNWDGVPTNPQVFTATGLNATHNGGATNFDMYVDAGAGVGNATQVRVSYDFTGNGSWDRLETYNYFPTDPVAGYEHYTHASGVKTSTGSFAALANGSVRVEVWSAIGNGATTLGIGNQSRVVLPYTGTTSQPSVNVALNKPVVVSSTENANFPGSAAVDGNTTTTRWSSAFSDPQTIRVDLGQTYSISRVRLVWEAAYGSAYQIQTSPDGNTWTTIRSVTGGDGGVDDLTGLTGSGRYVRVNATTRATAWGYSLFEFEVYAP
ncbi:glycosyl hydrolase [Catellatospora aurea]|uniref:glucan endo-1,3-beta-D-glucosidase n=1 Tax=Catellatospora aurea TaxID=1337874 RepID=A0ABW2GWR6_9ACTN